MTTAECRCRREPASTGPRSTLGTSGARLRNRRVGGGGRGRADNQQARKVRAPGPAVCPYRRRQPWPIGCLAQDPGQREQLARRHQLLNLAAAGVELAAVLVAGAG